MRQQFKKIVTPVELRKPFLTAGVTTPVKKTTVYRRITTPNSGTSSIINTPAARTPRATTPTAVGGHKRGQGASPEVKAPLKSASCCSTPENWIVSLPRRQAVNPELTEGKLKKTPPKLGVAKNTTFTPPATTPTSVSYGRKKAPLERTSSSAQYDAKMPYETKGSMMSHTIRPYDVKQKSEKKFLV
ncbi:hypothetical protein DAPPUDRAFT_100157 [Daphnia pulex]|uniref:Uncharacterized protein n=1 Tax=Daphnia pulex TaxID=6669 RepID=E9G9K1_DAPPU|nr:hypothetical protein DAPPUDRAFT_100157 [Daphnia pulex]|eukprot:EFX83865.1 hypothetical protein DAPPUDRAFT_100157 [Daphnia pulex]